MEKKWEITRIRMTGEMLDQVRLMAEDEDRQLQDQLRHLVRLGLELIAQREAAAKGMSDGQKVRSGQRTSLTGKL